MLGESESTAETQAILSLMQTSFELRVQMISHRNTVSQKHFDSFCHMFDKLRLKTEERFKALASDERKVEGSAELSFLEGIYFKFRQTHHSRSRANSSLIVEPGASLRKSNLHSEPTFLV